METVILHSDANSFYASCECLYRPEIRERPVAVCGDPEARHGIILAKNQFAKKFGIQTGEVIWQAKQKCPSLVVIPANYPLYMHISQQLRDVYLSYKRKRRQVTPSSSSCHPSAPVQPKPENVASTAPYAQEAGFASALLRPPAENSNSNPSAIGSMTSGESFTATGSTIRIIHHFRMFQTTKQLRILSLMLIAR